jgi:type I restriction enzyme R subunit
VEINLLAMMRYAASLSFETPRPRKNRLSNQVAYALPPINREERAARAKGAIGSLFDSKQQAFLDFVLSHYVNVGVEELDQEKLTPLLRLKYQNSISDALADLGSAEDIGEVFTGFQKYLYQHQASA